MTNKQQLKIDLTKLTYGPHPEVEKVYQEANADHLHWRQNPSYVNEERLRLCSQASGKPIKYKIQSCYRRVLPGGREYLLFHMDCQTFDYFGNIVQFFMSGAGKYEKPIIHKTYGIPQGRRMVANTDVTKQMAAEALEVSLESFEDVYEWPFENYVEQLREWYKTGVINENTNLYVWQGSSKYTIDSFENFVTLGVDDLTLLSKAGSRFAGLLKAQEVTPKILDAIREKLQTEVITQINTDKK